jgi:hypothetical protein
MTASGDGSLAIANRKSKKDKDKIIDNIRLDVLLNPAVKSAPPFQLAPPG